MNNSTEHIKRYAKEIYLRDRTNLEEKLISYTLMEEIHSSKALMTLAFLELLEEVEEKDIIFNIAFDYLGDYRSNLIKYEKETRETKKDLALKKLDENLKKTLKL